MIHILQQSFSHASSAPSPSILYSHLLQPNIPRVLRREPARACLSLQVGRLCSLAGPRSSSLPSRPEHGTWSKKWVLVFPHRMRALGTGSLLHESPQLQPRPYAWWQLRQKEKEPEEVILAGGPAICGCGLFLASEWDKPGKTGEGKSADKERIIGAKKTKQLAWCREEAGRLLSQIGNRTTLNGVFSLLTIVGKHMAPS